MNYVPLIDVNDKSELMEVENVMKNFKYVFHQDTNEIHDLFNIQAIIEEGRIDDFMKCIQRILDYSFNTYNNNSVKIIDPSFIKFFHVAQLIIKFLLYWKSELHKDNMKLKMKCQEVDKLRKECFAKKLEIKELKKQLFRFQKADSCEFKDPNISECTQCRKVFVNPIFLYAHYKRRHADQLFPHIRESNELEILEGETRSPKYQLEKVCLQENQSIYRSDNVRKHEEGCMAPLKMKIISEQSCLEAQEKYWRGKLKEISDQFTNEKIKLKHLSDELLLENSNLKKHLASISQTCQKCPVAVQTEISLIMPKISKKQYTIQNSKKHHVVSADMKNEPSLQQIQSIPIKLNPKFEYKNLNESETSTPQKNEFSSNEVVSLTDEKLIKSKLYDFNDLVSMNKNTELISKDLFSTSFSTLTADFSDQFLPSFLSASSSRSSSSLSYFNDQSEIHISSPKKNISSLQKKNDVVKEVESFLKNYDKSKTKTEANGMLNMNPNREKPHTDVTNVITKLFPADTDSVELADKLIRIYEKRRSLIPEKKELTKVATGNDSFDGSDGAILMDLGSENMREVAEQNSFSISKEVVLKEDDKLTSSNDRIREVTQHYETVQEIKNPNIDVKCDETDKIIMNESSSTVTNMTVNIKEKSKILPFFRNIPLKIKKNYAKSRKTCMDMIENKLIRKLPPLNSQNGDLICESFSPADKELEETANSSSTESNSPTQCDYQSDLKYDTLRNNVKCLPKIGAANKSKERTLVSALKKSKSTGNITKKVAFMDDLPTSKTVSETDLRKIPDLKPKLIPKISIPETVGSIHLHYDKFDRPVPAPRAKKNLIRSRSCDQLLESGCSKYISDIEENMK